MNIEEINIDIENLRETSNDLKNDFLIDVSTRYVNSLEQILTLLATPLFLMAHSMIKARENYLSIENAVELGILINKAPKDPKETAEILRNFFKKSIEKNKDNTVEEAIIESNKICEKNPEIRDCFKNIGMNALVNTWTLFETFSKEIWIKCLNEHPELLNLKIANSKGENETEVVGKNITINLLSKYNYNISNHLGEILSAKYDFTSVEGIRKAFKDLFNIQNKDLSSFDNTNLNQFEITRHILVHNSGIIDNRYLIRSKRQNEKSQTMIELDIQEISVLMNSSIFSIVEILKLVDNKIKTR